MNTLELLMEQITALSWLRCCIEEGVEFVNKRSNEIETNEIVIYKNLQRQNGVFDVPSAKCSPKGLEKNVWEVVGNIVVYHKNPEVTQTLVTPEFASAIKALIEKIQNS
jgi:hypothetical protein